jgi:hypothetical protein
MNRSNRALLAFALGLALTASVGCSDHNIALVGRETLPARASQPVQNEVVRTVARVDSGSNEIHLRPTPGQPGMVTYSADSRVMYLGRAYSVSQLRLGDVVAMQMEHDARGNPHTRMIRLKESAGDWARRNNS